MNLNSRQSRFKSTLLASLKLIRVKQWVKNTFVFAPLVFAGLFTDSKAIFDVSITFLLFCLGSSIAYIINDLFDIEKDRNHPIKSEERPLASGELSKNQALGLVVIFSLLLLFGGIWQHSVGVVVLLYILLNFFYSIYLKHQPIIDIFIISIGFVMRVYAGAVAVNVPVSPWMFVTTLCLALFLASLKRKQELILAGKDGRKVLQHYNVSLVDKYAQIASTGALLFYSLFVMTSRPNMVFSIPFVLYGIFRYWYLVESLKSGESPTDALLSDYQLIVTILLWAGVCMWTLFPSGA